ncbi:hypothetical protein RFI_36783 [Reticulomyxa filosa]|uniref:Uncharacterized protein n=1 Tax=Reticulomyxa filosa TaxID=46433 RepID=X6LGZ4_RETFI|nr:hypothetical protein RFI_36783 [Reticulomyxa filosa]|eukprot:ETO00656.1 hypothetical protein RFI_36783 [Reticulomyxa filosa]
MFIFMFLYVLLLYNVVVCVCEKIGIPPQRKKHVYVFIFIFFPQIPKNKQKGLQCYHMKKKIEIKFDWIPFSKYTKIHIFFELVVKKKISGGRGGVKKEKKKRKNVVKNLKKNIFIMKNNKENKNEIKNKNKNLFFFLFVFIKKTNLKIYYNIIEVGIGSIKGNSIIYLFILLDCDNSRNIISIDKISSFSLLNICWCELEEIFNAINISFYKLKLTLRYDIKTMKIKSFIFNIVIKGNTVIMERPTS